MVTSNDIKVLLQNNPCKNDIVELLKLTGEERKFLFKAAAETKTEFVDNIVYFRGLVEYSNICRKNCFYCGIRKDNKNVQRYTMTDEEVVNAALYAYKERYASFVLQSGERNSETFTNKITNLLRKINLATNNALGITLSLGEQNEDTLLEWKNESARRYLLRIEVSNPELYKKIHPNNSEHNFEKRLQCLKLLRKLNYQVGTGIMVGLPFQTLENLSEDILFFKENNIDMLGMGPYVEHSDTPLWKYRNTLFPLSERFELTLKMIAIMRIMMKNINIVASTAMQAIDKTGREKAIIAGANIMMPNLTPKKYRENYLLYQNKPYLNEDAYQSKESLEAIIRFADNKIGYGEWGDSKHFFIC